MFPKAPFSRLLPTGLIVLLAVPFAPFWPDYEAARRGLLAIAAAGLALNARRWLPRRPTTLEWLLFGMAGWHLLRTLGTSVPGRGLETAATWFSLAAWTTWARSTPVQSWRRGAWIAGILVATLGILQGLGLTQHLYDQAWQANPHTEAWGPWRVSILGFLGFNAGAPVATLGNTNVAAEFATIAAAVGLAGVATGKASRMAIATLALLSAYLVVNGSRSGLLALPVAAVWALSHHSVSPRGRVVAMVSVVGGGALALLTTLAPPAPAPDESPATTSPSTVEVRVELWKSCLDMAADAPVLGHGAGQFAIEYPRFRSQAEIDLSTTGVAGPRSFAAAPRTAHNDYLQTLTETGIPGLILWLAILIAGLRQAGTRLDSAPWIALALLCAVRSPVGNAPAIALVLGATAARAERDRPPAPWPAALATIVLALGTGYLGTRTLASQTAAAGYLQSAKFPRLVDRLAILDRSVAWKPDDPDLRQLHLRELLNQAAASGDTPDAARLDPDLDALAQLLPNDTTILLWRAEIAHRLRQPGRALNLLQRVRALDPREPQAAILEAVVHTERGDPGAAVVTLYRDPHPRLRAELPRTFEELAARAEALERPRVEILTLRAEAAFLSAIDALKRDPNTATAEVTAFADLILREGLGDVRPLILMAIQFVLTGNPDGAAVAGREASRRGIRLSAPHRRMLDGLESELRDVPEWQPLFDHEQPPRPL